MLSKDGKDSVDIADLLCEFQRNRRGSEDICASLEIEDYGLQAMEDASPPKWHLAHTTWFFERFLLAQDPSYRVFDPSFDFLFNSYYETAGRFHPRAKRGLLSRPTVKTVYAYRKHVDQAMDSFFRVSGSPENASLLELGIEHEKQHQELLLMDIKYNFFAQPLASALFSEGSEEPKAVGEHHWVPLSEGVYKVGCDSKAFAYDNERPAHRVYIPSVALGNRLISNAEYMDFVRSRAYGDVSLWLSEGWQWVKRQDRKHPLYWKQEGADWSVFTHAGWQPLDPHDAVSHVSYFEADAYARWRGCRLPTEEEWEVYAENHPRALSQLWQWTSSSYAPYPGFRTLPGSLGEYNGKFMVNQYVLRGGSHATPARHIRTTYRNFFPASAQWQFSGIRIAKEL